MTTRAAKLKTAAAPAPPAEPSIPVTIVMGRNKAAIDNNELATATIRAFQLHRDIKAVEPELKELKAIIVQQIEPLLDGSGTLTILTEGISCKVTTGFEYSIDESAVDALKKALGKRFADLVKVKTVYRPELKLVDMSCEPDAPAEIRDSIQVKSKSPAFTFGEVP